jgi:hypothetical protein
MLQQDGVDRSAYSAIVEEIKTLLKVRQTCITHVKRSQNSNSYFLADYARINASTGFWLVSSPEGLASICYDDCNPHIS